jgi:uncharacterized protein with FMN-binding domain
VSARANIAGALTAAAVLSLAWFIGSTTQSGPSTTTAPGTTPSTRTPSAGAAKISGSFTGTSESTRYGSVQVKIVVAAGKITDIVPLALTNQGGRSVQISNHAAPILRAEVLKAQSAKVSTVSGATYTSDAYLLSLQSAIDKAGI